MRQGRTDWRVLWIVLAVAPLAAAEVRVQDIARLQGQRTNKLMGYGLVVGLSGTGDGEKYAPTMRALMRMHERYHAPILSEADIKGNRSVALVAVEATIPEFGAREGQAVDVTVSAIGTAKSLRGGQLLTTPLQFAMFDDRDPGTQYVLALAGGMVSLPDELSPTRGVLRQGATLEQNFFYAFIEGDAITLVLDDTHAGWTWAHMVARAINHELVNPMAQQPEEGGRGENVAVVLPAEALGPKNIRVRIPTYELASPASYISRILQTSLFMLPQQVAKVTINRTTKNVAFTGNVQVSPTVLQIPGLGTVLIGKKKANENGESAGIAPVEFSDLLDTLAAIKVTPEQLMDAVEHLYKTGSLHAQVQYE